MRTTLDKARFRKFEFGLLYCGHRIHTQAVHEFMAEPTSKRARWYLPTRRWLRFSLRGLFFFTLLLSLPLGWLGMKLANKRAERELVHTINDTGGAVAYTIDAECEGALWRPAFEWLAELVGEDLFLYQVETIHWHPGLHDVDAKSVLSRLIKRSPQLKELVVSEIGIGDAEMMDFKRLTSLEELQVVGAPISDIGIANLTKLPKLERLNLDRTEISDAGLNELARLSSLVEIHVAGTRISQDGYARFTRLQPLVAVFWAPPLDERAEIAAHELCRRSWHVDLGEFGGTSVMPAESSALTNEERAWLLSLPRVETFINLKFPEQAKTLAFFADLDNLSRLTVTGIDDQSFGELHVPKELRELRLWDHSLSNEGLAKLTEFPRLQELLLKPSPTGKLAIQQVGRASNLRRITLWKGAFANDDLLPLTELEELEELEFLEFHFEEHATSPLGSMRRLKRLWLGNGNLDDDGLPPIHLIASLECLTVQGTQITDTGFLRLAEIKSLNELHCSNCRRVSSKAREQFQKLRPDVRFNKP